MIFLASMVARIIDNITLRHLADPEFWEGNAPWYELWLRHNDYHARVKDVLATRVRPEWRILDVGGGSGVLSLYLQRIGCRVVLLEPARAMQALFRQNAASAAVGNFSIEERRWENLPLGSLSGFDLILACNSLHATNVGFAAALEKVFAAGASHVFVVAEAPYSAVLKSAKPPDCMLVHSEIRDIPSSWAYHRPEEALDHAAFRKGCRLEDRERDHILISLVFEDEHFWLKNTARVRLEWWTRTA
jgi:SAM-dependent methyltransferase